MKAQIVLATHNPRFDLLHRQVGSLIAQTESDWQCLVLDDTSSDRFAIASVLSDPRFTLLAPREHLGPYRAFEHLLQSAATVPVFLCDQDDYWHPEKMSRLLAVPGTAFSAMRVVDERGSLVRDRFLPPPTDLTPAGLLLMNCVSGTALKITPEVLAAALPFPAPTLRGWHDQWLAAVAARVGTLTHLEQPLVDYTQHDSQVIGDGLRTVTPQRLRRFTRRPQLRARTDWIRVAAHRLLELSGPADEDLEAIAAGRFRQVLRRHSIPRSRAALLLAGRWG